MLSNDVDVGVRFGDAELVTEDDRLIAAHIDKMSDLAQPYRNRRSKKPRNMALTVSGLEDGKNIFFIALIHPIQWTIALPVGATGPAKRQKKTFCI